MLKFIIPMLIASCGPAELKSNLKSADTNNNIVDTEPPVLGVNERDDCDQKALGSSVCNFVLLDQNGDYWNLYDYHGKVIILDFSTAWCYPCQMAAAHTQSVQDDYASDVIFVTLLIQGETDLPATAEDVTTWVETHGITTAPVLQASRDYIMDPAGITGYLVGGYPTYVYLDRDLTIADAHVGYSEEHMKNILDGLIQ